MNFDVNLCGVWYDKRTGVIAGADTESFARRGKAWRTGMTQEQIEAELASLREQVVVLQRQRASAASYWARLATISGGISVAALLFGLLIAVVFAIVAPGPTPAIAYILTITGMPIAILSVICLGRAALERA
jgi:hypothetical protein